MNPLPSLIRASAFDAADMAMRQAGRKAWSEDDYNLAASTLERLIRSCYGRPNDHNQPNMCFIRFSIAEQMERAGSFNLSSDVTRVQAAIDTALAA
jgi:hypothetical protein